jgi:uncharacterized protein YebE (UPF0316 family)
MTLLWDSGAGACFAKAVLLMYIIFDLVFLMKNLASYANILSYQTRLSIGIVIISVANIKLNRIEAVISNQFFTEAE